MHEADRWRQATTEWLKLTQDSLVAHAIKTGEGERGVLLVTADLAEMENVIAAAKKPNMRIRMTATPTWVPIDEFLTAVRDEHVDATAAERYRPALEVMDATRDAALFLSSVPAADGSFYSRFLIINSLDGTVH